MNGKPTNLISESRKLMIPLQISMSNTQSDMISQIMSKAVSLDIFSSALSLVELSASLIVEMEKMGMTDEVEALKKDWVNIVTNPHYDEFVDLDKIPKNQIGKWKIDNK